MAVYSVHTNLRFSLHHPVLIDSGANTDFMDFFLATDFGLGSEPLENLLTKTALHGRLFCTVVNPSPPVTLSFSDRHQEQIFLVQHSSIPSNCGLSHKTCLANSRVELSTTQCVHEPSAQSLSLDEDKKSTDLSSVPPLYSDHQDVFNKAKEM